MPFADRRDAGRRLARRVEHLRGTDPVVLGLPRGGVPVAYELALALDAPLDVVVVRKLGVPYEPELAMGAIGEDGVRVLNPEVLRGTLVTDRDLAAVEERERGVLHRRLRALRRGRPPVPLAGRTVIVVDDGIATGSTARAACCLVRARGAARVVLAAPVAPRGVPEQLLGPDPAGGGPAVDEVVCVETPRRFTAIGRWYGDFTQVSDDEVVELLDRAGQRPLAGVPAGPVPAGPVPAGPVPAGPVPAGPVPGDRPPRDEDVGVPLGGSAQLDGHLLVPPDAGGIVVFAHGSGSSRLSPRNRYVASVLTTAGLGVLLFDLLTPAEERDRSNVFDVPLLAGRLEAATGWLRGQPEARRARFGYFGASTGAAAALWAAAADDRIAAVVSRGGRPDLAGARLAAVRAPTLLIVGGDDQAVLGLNRAAQAMLRCENALETVPGAGHLFEEPGTLQRAAELARDWFLGHLRSPSRPAPAGRDPS